MIKIIRTKEVRGRHTHRCSLCGLRIRKGALHAVTTWTDGNAIYTDRYHAVCLATTADWGIEEWEDGPNPGAFRQFDLRLGGNQ